MEWENHGRHRKSRIIELVAKSKNLPPSDVRMESTFDELQIDSLDKINLSFAVEEMFSHRDSRRQPELAEDGGRRGPRRRSCVPPAPPDAAILML
jgi:hypothetical protein